MAITIPSTLKLTHLRSLAFQCGISTSGTKTVLTNRLLNEIRPTIPNHGPKQSRSTRILSIDMGIRNLAYCILDLPPNSIQNGKSPVAEVIAWQRIAVLSAPKLIQDPDKAVPLVKEAFDPLTLSSAAYTLLRETLLPYKPEYILIERQRFRSMGSPHILEWTIRVNMFESMLYAVLRTLKSESIWQGSMVPLPPGKVGPFWLEPKEVLLQEKPSPALEKSRTTKSTRLLNKGAKIDLVRHWLETKQIVSLATPEAELSGQAYLKKWRRPPGRAKGRKSANPDGKVQFEEMGKLDDLADSLLQAMAWIEWEKKKVMVLKSGVGALHLA